MASAAAAIPAVAEPTSHTAHIESLSPAPSIGSVSGGSEDDAPPNRRLERPKMSSRKSSGTMIITSNAQPVVVEDDEYDEDDVRTMSPRRNSAEVDKLSEDARNDLKEQAKVLQTSLQDIVDKIEKVKMEQEKLEAGNKFLQSYIGELMSTSKITAAPTRNKGKGRNAR